VSSTTSIALTVYTGRVPLIGNLTNSMLNNYGLG